MSGRSGLCALEVLDSLARGPFSTHFHTAPWIQQACDQDLASGLQASKRTDRGRAEGPKGDGDAE